MEEQDDKIYRILQQKNVIFTIFKEIDTILFDVKNSSSRLIKKILQNASQYHDTQIILDLGSNHSKNIIRRLINSTRSIQINAPKIVLRLSKDYLDGLIFTKYLKLIPTSYCLDQIFHFQLQYGIKYNIYFMSISFQSQSQLQISLNDITAKIDYKIGLKKCSSNVEEQVNTLIDNKTNLPILQNLEEVITQNLPIYGIENDKIFLIIESISLFIYTNKYYQESKSCNIFLDDLAEFINSKKSLVIDKFEFKYEYLEDQSEMFEKVQDICEKSIRVENWRFYNQEEDLKYDQNLKSLRVYVKDEPKNKPKIIPQFKIDQKLDILQIKFDIQNKNIIDLSEYILRCRRCQSLVRIDLNITHSDILQRYHIPISDLFDLLSKLKGVTSYSINIQRDPKKEQFYFTYQKYSLKDKTNKEKQNHQYHTIKQSEEQLELVPHIIFRDDVNNLQIRYQESLVSINQFHSSISKLLSNTKINRYLKLSFLQLLKNQVSYSSVQQVVQGFRFVNLEFRDFTQLLAFNIDEDLGKKTRKIKIAGNGWPKQSKISTLIERYPNLIQLKVSKDQYYSKAIIYLHKIKQFQKYINVKNSLFILLKKISLKRIEMVNDLIQEFLC